jgi:hypothetical protein
MNDKVRSARRLAYQRTFCGDGTTPHLSGERVLADLRRFAHIDSGGIVVSPVTRTTDPYATCYRAGLRDMYLRIAAHLGIDEAKNFPPIEELRDEQAQT